MDKQLIKITLSVFIIGNLPTERSEKFPRMIGNNSHHTRQSQYFFAQID